MRYVLIIFLTDVFHQFLARQQNRVSVHQEGFRVCPGVVNVCRVIQMPQIRTRKPFDDMQLLGVRMSGEVEPELIVEPDAVDYQCVSLPVPD